MSDDALFVLIRAVHAAVVAWARRRVLAHRVSTSMDTSFCIEAIEEAFARHGKPEIFNTDPGSPFTRAAFVQALKERDVPLSMDGRGATTSPSSACAVPSRARLKTRLGSVTAARAQLRRFIEFYNTQRPHSSLDKKTPDEFCFATLPAIQQSA